MNNALVSIGLAVAVAATAAGMVGLHDLPDAACNDGTANAHERIPEMTGAGSAVPGDDHVPRLVDGNCTTGVEAP